MITNQLISTTGEEQKTRFTKAGSEIDILKTNLNYEGKVVIDVGCGAGKISKMLASLGAFVIGIDTPELISLAEKQDIPQYVVFKTGTGQNLPLKNDFADIILFYASFHHVPECEMNNAVKECYRVLKKNGVICFCEPLTDKGSYYDLTGLIEDEEEIRAVAYSYISLAGETDFHLVSELYYYLERTFEDFRNLLNIYVTDPDEKDSIIMQAKEIVEKRDKDIDSVKFRSLVRMNILKKKIPLRF